MKKIVECPKCGTKYDSCSNEFCPTPKSNYLWILDNGHGGIIDGEYQTPGKRSPVWEDGSQLFEGEFNRAIVNRLVKMCAEKGIECINLVDTQEDTPLSKRTAKANSIHREKGNTIYMSIHANGFNKESNFWVLRKTAMPAILSENFFMTNYDNCHKYLLSEEGRDRIAKIHFEMILEIEEKKLV